jgi:hypothetical protein
MNFVSGKELEINEKEFNDIPVTLASKGVKVKRMRSGAVVPMNSTTIEFIQAIPEESDLVEKEEPMEEHDSTPEIKKAAEEQLDVQIEKPKPKTQQEMLDEITAKSNCKHEADKLELYVQHTAKGKRYFPVCSFCGKRERYISEKKVIEGLYAGTVNGKWTSTDILNAKDWIED